MARITRGRVLEKIAQYWPDADRKEILGILDRFGEKSSEQGRSRVQLAILKLSERKRERLEGLVRDAKRDYRDVLAYAEYPKEMKIGFVGMSQMP
jgi:hypothetical protein